MRRCFAADEKSSAAEHHNTFTADRTNGGKESLDG